MISQTVILFLAAAISSTLQLPCKISVHCICGSTGNNVTSLCVEEDIIDELCSKWSGCTVCPKGQECLKCPGNYLCKEATSHKENHRQKRQSINSRKNTCNNPGLISNGNKVYISPLNKLTDGSFEDNKEYPQGSRLLYSCSEGYDVDGEEVLTCEPGGNWTYNPPSCKKQTGAQCNNPGPAVNGKIVYISPLNEIKRSYYENGVLKNEIPEDIPVGGLFLYSCDCGYELSGGDMFFCGPEDRWMLYPPYCIEESKKACRDLGPISNGKKVYIPPFNKLTDEFKDAGDLRDDNEYRLYSQGGLLRYSCIHGYKLKGEEWLTCESEGTWSSEPPSCEKEKITFCDNPKPISNGNQLYIPPLYRHANGSSEEDVNNKIPEGGRLMYFCDDGYYLEGEEVLTCRYKYWASEPPLCKKEEITYCDSPGPISNGRRVYISPLTEDYETSDEFSDDDMDDRGYPPRSQFDYSCKYGYELEGEEVLTCKSDGSWTSKPPSCKRDNRPLFCSDPGPIFNGQTSYLPGPSENRKGPIPVPDEEQFPEGATLKYACNSGYTMTGMDSMTCESSGYWSGTPPSCDSVSEKYIMHCDDPGPIIDGKVAEILPPKDSSLSSGAKKQSEEFPEGTILQYSCEDGYNLDGSSELTCLNTSYWSDLPPTCNAECGLSNVTASRRITNGEKTLPGDWPWVVAIAVERRNGYKEKVCGGALWSSGVVVTAAHCLTDADTFILYFGKVHLEDKHDDADVQVRTSTEVILHPLFNSTTYEFDIGLVKFEPRITFSNRTIPICPPTAFTTSRNLKPGRDGFVTGFGETEKGVQADDLLLAVLPYQTNEACIESYRSENVIFPITRNMFCAGYESAKQSACSGDSGSPLVFYNKQTRRYSLEGIVSFGGRSQCGTPKMYTVFTKVFPFVPWILSNLVGI